MTFRDLLARDNVNVFLNTDEFAETHVINGAEMACQIDNNELIEREKKYQQGTALNGDGVYVKQLLLYVHADDFGALPAVGRLITVDKKKYIVTDAINEDGIYSLTLEAMRS